MQFARDCLPFILLLPIGVVPSDGASMRRESLSGIKDCDQKTIVSTAGDKNSRTDSLWRDESRKIEDFPGA